MTRETLEDFLYSLSALQIHPVALNNGYDWGVESIIACDLCCLSGNYRSMKLDFLAPEYV